MTINAGNFDREITIETAPYVQDAASGELVLDWARANSQTVWAAWLPKGTKETWQAEQRLAAYVEGVFRIYDIQPRPSPAQSRILDGDRIFDVKPYIEPERNGKDGLLIPVTARGE